MFEFKHRPAVLAVAFSALMLATSSFAQAPSPATPQQPPSSGTSETMPNPAPNAPSQYPPANAATPQPNTNAAVGTTTRAPHAAATKTARPDDVEGRIKKMHDRLKVTSDQESDWKAVADAMRNNAQTMKAQIDQRNQNYKKMNAVDNLKSYQEMTSAHADGLKKLDSAFSKLYGDFTDAQKKNADSVFREIAARHEHKPAAAPKTNG